MTDLEEAKEFFIKDRYAMVTSGIDILEVRPKYAKCILNIEDKHMNVANTVMGGAIFTLADFCFAVASNFKQGHAVSLNSTINFLRPGTGKYLTAESEIVKDGRTIINYNINVRDDQDRLVSVVNINGLRVE
ncbi:MAG: PaaI family thioesterase [Treponema sp.]|nr:PaaI family thioesterase [Treponema sp.]